MEKKAKSGKNTRKKQKDQDSAKQEDTGTGNSLLKKNELSIIFIGAGILTVVIFFIFFSPSGEKANTKVKQNTTPDGQKISSQSSPELTQLQKQIKSLETMVKEELASGKNNLGEEDVRKAGTEEQPAPETINSYRQRLERVETVLTVKLEAVNNRIDGLEKRMAQVSDKITTLGSASGSEKKEKVSVPKEKKSVPGDEKEKSMFHTVEKGDTLYSISRKYNVGLDKLRSMNNLDKDSDIYPGDNLVIK